MGDMGRRGRSPPGGPTMVYRVLHFGSLLFRPGSCTGLGSLTMSEYGGPGRGVFGGPGRLRCGQSSAPGASGHGFLAHGRPDLSPRGWRG